MGITYGIGMQRVLGIDPGLRITGYGLVVVQDSPGAPGDVRMTQTQREPTLLEGGVIRLDTRLPMEGRLEQLHRELVEIIDEHNPHCLAVEKLYAHYKHPRTAILMAHARGVILLAARQHGVPIVHMPSTEVKKATTGYGRASKQQIQRSIQRQFNLPQPPSPPDVADAIAIALTGARRITMSDLTQQQTPSSA